MTTSSTHKRMGSPLSFGLLAFALLQTGVGTAAEQTIQSATTVLSPDGKVAARVGVLSSGRLAYEVSRAGKPVLAPSPLGVLVDSADLGQSVKLDKPRTRKFSETYPIPGWHGVATNRFSEAVFHVTQSAGGQTFELAVRVFNDGVAVRYLIPLAGRHQIDGEATAWQLAPAAQAWWSPLDASYEGLYRGTPADAVTNRADLETPVTFRLAGSGVYVALSEADCENYPDMALQRDGDSYKPFFWANKTGWTNEGPLTSPWRVTLIAPDLNALANTDIFTNLSPPPAPELARADWIRPGRVLWQWYSSGSPKLDEQHAWFDAAARLKWEYYLIDDGWRTWHAEGKDQWQCLKDAIDYGKTVGVASIVWVNSSEMRDATSRRAYLERVKATGAAGIKIDFIPPATPEIMQWYVGALRDTADLKLLCNFHGSVKPTGLRRTWPHELTREAVRGQEYHITRFRRTMPLDTDTIIPFTRYLQGPADYTPMVFDPKQLRGFTWPRELASAIVFTSPLMHYGDSYLQYVGNPAEDVLRVLPTVWDETRVLEGTEIGKVVAFARRKGNDWYVAVMNGAAETHLTVNLSFLKKGQWHCAEFFDVQGKDDAFDRQEKSVSGSDTIPLTLRPGGGFVARLTQ